MRSLSILGLAMLLGGCVHRGAPAPVPVRGPARDSLIQLDLSRGDTVAAHGAIDGALLLLHPDVVYLRGGAPAAYGRDAARALFIANPPTPGTAFLWQPLSAELSADGRAAYTFGIASRAGAGKSPLRADRY